MADIRDDYPKCYIVVKRGNDNTSRVCGQDGVNAIKLDDDRIVYRCREHTDPRMNVVVGPGSLDGGN